MLRLVRKPNLCGKLTQISKSRNSSATTHVKRSSGASRWILTAIASVGTGFTGAVLYGKYNSEFRELLENNVPYVDQIYSFLEKNKTLSELEEKGRRILSSNKTIDSSSDDRDTQALASKIKNMSDELLKSSQEMAASYEAATVKIKEHSKCLKEYLSASENKDMDVLFESVKNSYQDRQQALDIASKKAFKTRKLSENLHNSLGDPLLTSAGEATHELNKEIQSLEDRVNSLLNEDVSKNCQELISTSKKHFLRELETMSPEGWKNKKVLTGNDLTSIISHAHSKIESLLKKLAEQRVKEEQVIYEAIQLQKLKDDKISELKVKEELAKYPPIDPQTAYYEKVEYLLRKFEFESQQQMVKQTAAHVQHIKEVLKDQADELKSKYNKMFQKELQDQQNLFTSELSEKMDRLNRIQEFLKSKDKFDSSFQKIQSLWLACQSANQKLNAHNNGDPYSLADDIVAIQAALEDDNQFAKTVIQSIPTEARNNGVYNRSVLRDRFTQVKKSCRRVALIDEKKDSLYRYLISYLQSLFILDSPHVPKAELEGKVRVDPSEWDTFAILNRVSYCLQRTDLEQALRYANQLKGKPRDVASDWMKEVCLLLETQLAMKALLAHAAAMAVQGCH